ncbi:MAG: hypothetical protein QG597_977, partial [Actinomycetota bacterium]|nr:hypothetical protein [Actinomycetota bacterium]
MVAPPALVRATVAQVITAYGIDVERRLAAGAMAQTTADTYARDLADFLRLAGADTILDDLSGDDVDDIVLAF